jgi:hypothetical protein
VGRDEGGEDSKEVVGRVEDFFSQNIEPSTNSAMKAVMPLRGLKAVMLEIEWEITDDTMTRLIDQANRLKKMFSKNKILLLFLQLLISVGKYIKAKKAHAHPDSIHLLNSVYTSLEHVFLSTAMTGKEKKGLLLIEVDKFNKLKEIIAGDKANVDTNEDVPQDEATSTDLSQMDHRMALAFMLEEITKVIQEEFKSLKAELRMNKNRASRNSSSL